MHPNLVKVDIVEPGIAVITINRPAVMNALDLPTVRELERALDRCESDSSIRVVIVTGAGDRAFVAGGDIQDLTSRRGLAHYQEFAEDIHRVFRRFETTDKPTIGAVNGWTLGGGLELLLCLDIRVAAEDAKLGLPEIRIGLFPGAGGSQRLPRQISSCMAREMMFTGEHISSQQALAIGLVNRIVPQSAVLSESLEIARRIAGRSPLVLKLLKRTLLHGLDMPLAAALSHEQAMIGLVLDSADAHEGCEAFLEKRAAKFEGR